MQINDEDVRRFQEIWSQEFREEISEEFAKQRLAELDELYLMLSRPISKPDSGFGS